MILVTLGTQDKQFKRLIEAVENQIEKGNITDKVIIQAGCTKYEPKAENKDKIEILEFLSGEKFDELFNKADIIITHAGVGSIIKGLESNKKMIVAARLEKYGEHVNDHQTQILESFSEQGYILPLKDFEKLDEVLEQLKNFEPKEYKKHNEEFTSKMKKEISNLLNS